MVAVALMLGLIALWLAIVAGELANIRKSLQQIADRGKEVA
jgi:hypothetical protein